MKEKMKDRCSMILMNVLVDQLRERYSAYVFSLNRGGLLWELRCYEDHWERWCLRGGKSEIEREIRYLLETAGDTASST
jgi:hypothetical protein